MKAVYQRVSRASVTVDGNTVGAIDQGILLLVGVSGDVHHYRGGDPALRHSTAQAGHGAVGVGEQASRCKG